jgi:dTDP-4-amino-4,6-dideoxygalactose transaminase
VGHVRINIPAWGARELLAGAGALAAAGRRTASREALQRVVAALVPGWTPSLVASARYGIALAIRALGLAGRRVAVPAYVCPAVLTGLRGAPAKPIPVDCLPASLAFDTEALERAGVDAVLAPNTYGVDQDYAALERLGLPVVEDAAYQAGRTDPEGRVCGTRGEAGVWSFNFKCLTGVGGSVVLLRAGREAEPAAGGALPRGEAARFVNYAARAIARHRIPSFLPGAERPGREAADEVRASLNEMREASMSELQGAVALAQWHARERLAARQLENATAIARAAGTALGRPDALPHLVPVLAAGPDEARRMRVALWERGIQTEEPYPVPWDGFPNATALARRLVLVPCNASLGRAQVERIVEALSRRDAQARRHGGG